MKCSNQEIANDSRERPLCEVLTDIVVREAEQEVQIEKRACAQILYIGQAESRYQKVTLSYMSNETLSSRASTYTSQNPNCLIFLCHRRQLLWLLASYSV